MKCAAVLTRLQLRQNAWNKLRAAQALAEKRDWDNASEIAGYAVEFILKARICVDCGLTGFPETRQEFADLKHLKTHDLESLLSYTKQQLAIKQRHLNDWSVCLRWSPESRYQPMGTATEQSATELLRSAESIIRAISAVPGLEAAVVPATENPYVKLWAMEKEIAVEKGQFVLFAVWHRSGSYADSADVVVAAPWIDPDTREGARYVSEFVSRSLTESDLLRISGVIALGKDHPVVADVTSALDVKGFQLHCENCQFGNIQIDCAVIITSIPKPFRQ